MRTYLKITTISILFFVINIQAQNKYLKLHTNIGLPIEGNIMFFTSYPNEFRIYKEYNSYKDNKNKYPEQTLISVLSTTNLEWDKKNFNYEIEDNKNKYIEIQRSSKEDAFFELLSKITFKFDGNRYAIIKYHIKDKNKILPFASVLIKQDGKWKVIKPEGSLTKLYLMFTYVSKNALSALFNNEKINISSYDKYISDAYENDILNINIAINSNSKNTEEEYKIIVDPVMMKIKTEFKQKSYKKNKFDNLNSKKVYVSFIKRLDFQNFYQYVDESYYSAPEDNDLKLFLNQLPNNIIPIFRYTYKYEDDIFSIVKYQIIQDENKKQIKSAIFLKGKGNKWEINDSENKIYTIMKKINLSFYKELVSIHSKIPEIRNIKEEISVLPNIIDIEKLGEVLKNNQSSLKKYLDN